MFDSNTEKLLSTKIASIFRNSLVEIKAKLATIPPVLILMAPRHARSQRSYRYIIPDREITLDNEMVQLVCLKCKQTNHDSNQPIDFFFCNECYSKKPPSSPIPSTDANIICYCSRCLMELHRDLPENIRYKHDLKKMKNITKLKLFAVLCIETSHYVAFVKCHKSNQKDQWMFFDSMSDRIHNEINVPCVSSVADFDQWIQGAEDDTYYFEDLDKRRSQGKPTSQVFNEFEMRRLRLFRDGAFFFYENPVADYQ
jgi:ubiquitin thioesterase CYLD